MSSDPSRPSALEPPYDAVRTGLESCGLAVGDTIDILARLGSGETIASVSRQIGDGHLLTKRTLHGRRHVIAAIRRRYLSPAAHLPGVANLAAAIPRLSSDLARAQLLLPYLLSSDRAAYEVVTSAVVPRRERNEPTLSKADMLGALDGVFSCRARKPWSGVVCKRWVEGLLSVLRDVGVLGRDTERETLLPYSVRPDVFSFHLWGLYVYGLRGQSLVDSPFWRLLLLAPPEAHASLRSVAERGWWRITSLAGVVEAVPTASSIGAFCHELG